MSATKFFSPDDIPAIAVDDRERGFFILDDELIEDPTLTIYDRAVYAVIVKHASRTGPKASQARLRNSTIATVAGCSPRQVRNSIARLKTQKQPYSDSPWIAVYATGDARGQGSNVYQVLTVEKKPHAKPVAAVSEISTTSSEGAAPYAGGAAYHAVGAAPYAAITRGSINQRFGEQENFSKTAAADAAAGAAPLFPDSQPSKKKKKPEHPELEKCCAAVYEDYTAANQDVKLDYVKGYRVPAKALLRKIPDLTADKLSKWLLNRRMTPGVVHCEEPAAYLRSILRYKDGPLTEFNKAPTIGQPRTAGRSGQDKEDTTFRNIDDVFAGFEAVASA